jgi:ribosomal protein S18 acetylase RimI-like enzyme
VSASPSQPSVRCEALSPANAGELAQLFVAAGSACYCRYFHFEGDKNEWQARLAFESERNRAELLERAEHPPLAGVVAFGGEREAVGWMKLEPAAALPKLYGQRPYRALPGLGGSREGVWVVGCFLVAPAARGRGVARALLRRGIELLQAEGAKSLEAFPRRADGLRAEELWTGPFPLFSSEGFELVQGEGQYPVLRRAL